MPTITPDAYPDEAYSKIAAAYIRVSTDDQVEYFPNNMEWESDFKTRKKVL